MTESTRQYRFKMTACDVSIIFVFMREERKMSVIPPRTVRTFLKERRLRDIITQLNDWSVFRQEYFVNEEIAY